MLCAVRGAVERLTENMGFSESECRSVTRAVDEAMANIIRHAYSDQRDQPIELTCHRTRRVVNREPEEGLEIVLKDQGVPADPAKMWGRPLGGIHSPNDTHRIATVSYLVYWERLHRTRRLKV